MAIKLIDNSAVFEVVSQYDDAIVNETPEEVEAIRAAGGSTRFDKYMDSLNLSDLVIKEGEAPTVFIVKGLTHKQRAELQEKHVSVDVTTKKVTTTDPQAYFADIYNLAVVGVKTSQGVTVQASAEEVGPMHSMSIGATVTHLTVLGKNLKKL